MRFKRFAVKKFLVVGLILKCFFGIGLTAAWAASLQIGDTPKLVATELNGESFDLSQKKGKWVIVNFFATWCPGCRTELPELVTLYQKYHAKNLELLVISPEPSRKKNAVMNFIKAFPIPAALLAEAKTNDFGSAVALPTTYLIDPKGVIKQIFAPDEKGKAFDAKAIEANLNQN